MAAYGCAGNEDATRGASVSCVPDLVEQVATAAERRRGMRLRRTSCDQFMWVRLEGDGGAEDWVLPLSAWKEER
jgi:hypothetical protein